MKPILCIVVILSSALGGCATDHALLAPVANMVRAGMVGDPKQVSRLEKAMTDRDIANLLDAGVRAKLPTPIAVAKVGSQCRGFQPYLDTVDANDLAGWEKTTAGESMIRGFHPISPLAHAAATPTLHSLRQAAARMGCELLLVYLQADSSVINFNDAAALYWTFVGLWLVPGNVIEHETVMQAVLVDCRTGMILATATGDCHIERSYPAAFEDTRRHEVETEAPRKALADLQESFRRHIPRVVATAVAKR